MHRLSTRLQPFRSWNSKNSFQRYKRLFPFIVGRILLEVILGILNSLVVHEDGNVYMGTSTFRIPRITAQRDGLTFENLGALLGTGLLTRQLGHMDLHLVTLCILTLDPEDVTTLGVLTNLGYLSRYRCNQNCAYGSRNVDGFV